MIKGRRSLDFLSGFGDLCAETDDKSEGFSTFQILPSVSAASGQSLHTTDKADRLCW